MLFKSQTPGPVQIVIRVSAEGDHGLGAGDAGDLGYSLGDDFGEPLEVGDTDHYDEVVGACDRVSLGDAVYREHGLGGFLNALPLRPDQHYSRYHAGSLHHITIKMIHIACSPYVFSQKQSRYLQPEAADCKGALGPLC